MVVITKTKLISFYESDSLAKEPISKWYHKTVLSNWQDYHAVKETFNSVDVFVMTDMCLMWQETNIGLWR